MKTTRTLLVSLFAAILVAGCAEMKQWMGHEGGGGHKARAMHCNSQQCRVQVRVSQQCAVDTTDVDVSAAPDNVRIVWLIQGPGEFTSNGIDVKGNGRFSGRSHSPKQFEWSFDNRTKNTRHKFDVNVTLGKDCATHDPFVMN